MITSVVHDEMIYARRRYNEAVDRNNGIKAEKERMKNLMFNYYDEILATLDEVQMLADENRTLKEKIAVYEQMMAENNARSRKKTPEAAAKE